VSLTFVVDNQLTTVQVLLAKALAATRDESRLMVCWSTAEGYYSKALALQPDAKTAALIWFNLGNLYKKVTESDLPSNTVYYRYALTAYSKALPIFHNEKAIWLEAISLINQARLYRDLGDFEKSLVNYTQALPLILQIRQDPAAYPFFGTLQSSPRELENFSELMLGLMEPGLLFDLAVNYALLGDYQQSVIWLKNYEKTIDDSRQDQIKTRVLEEGAKDQTPENRELYTYASQFFGKDGPMWKLGPLLLANFISQDTGDNQKACFYQQGYQQAVLTLLAGFTDLKSWKEWGSYLSFSKNNFFTQKNFASFFDVFQRTQIGDLGSCGTPSVDSKNMTQLAEAMDFIFTKVSQQEDLKDFVPYLSLIPAIFTNLNAENKPELTLILLEKFSPLLGKLGREQKNPMGNLMNILLIQAKGDVYTKRNQFSEAIQTYQVGLQMLERNILNITDEIKQESKSNLLEALGNAYSDSAQLDSALTVYRKALDLREAQKQSQPLAEVRYRLAQVTARQGNWATAKDYIAASLKSTESTIPGNLKISKNTGDLSVSSRASFGLPGKRGDFGLSFKSSKSESFGNSAIPKVNAMNSDLEKACTTLPTFLACKQKYYQFYIDLLMQRYAEAPAWSVTAFETSERARVYSPAFFRVGVEVDLDARSKPNRSSAIAQDSFSQPLKLAEIQRLLDPDTVLLEYFLGKEKSYLWMVSSNGFETFPLSANETAIDTQVREFYSLLTSPVGRARPKATAAAGQALSQILLAPVVSKLSGKRLLIVGDGVLQYLPFGTLPDPSVSVSSDPSGEFSAHMQPLLVNHEILNLPSASVMAAIRARHPNRPNATMTLGVFADPIFNNQDPRYQSLPPKSEKKQPALVGQHDWIADDFEQLYPRLPGSEVEANTILKTVPRGEGKAFIGFDANLPTALSDEMRQYRILHFATHGVFNTRSPQRSGLVLSTIPDPITGLSTIPAGPADARSGVVLSSFNPTGETQRGILTPRNSFDMKLSAADLVVLSGCRTGLGQNIRGEGLVGLTGGMMAAGAERVIVSLWSVQDSATVHLMQEFYQRLLNPKHPEYNPSPSRALRAAQLSMWRDPEWQTPYNWAAFTIQGEWR
jgi:CHAT domain-containing protein